MKKNTRLNKIMICALALVVLLSVNASAISATFSDSSTPHIYTLDYSGYYYGSSQVSLSCNITITDYSICESGHYDWAYLNTLYFYNCCAVHLTSQVTVTARFQDSLPQQKSHSTQFYGGDLPETATSGTLNTDDPIIGGIGSIKTTIRAGENGAVIDIKSATHNIS